jgi:hypothetical protein
MTARRWRCPRILCGAALLVCLSVPGAAARDLPICNRPEIVMAGLARLTARDAHILGAGAASEFATPRGDVVLCVLPVRIWLTDAVQDRAQAATIWQPRYFEVRRLAAGFEILSGDR